MKFVGGEETPCCSASESTFLWDIENRQRIWERTLYGRANIEGQISSASADGTRLAGLLSSGDIGVLDVADGNMTCELKGRAAALCDISLSPSDPVAAGAYTDGVVAIWDLRTGDICGLTGPPQVTKDALVSLQTAITCSPPAQGGDLGTALKCGAYQANNGEPRQLPGRLGGPLALTLPTGLPKSLVILLRALPLSGS